MDWNSSGGAVAGKLVKRYVGEKKLKAIRFSYSSPCLCSNHQRHQHSQVIMIISYFKAIHIMHLCYVLTLNTHVCATGLDIYSNPITNQSRRKSRKSWLCNYTTFTFRFKSLFQGWVRSREKENHHDKLIINDDDDVMRHKYNIMNKNKIWSCTQYKNCKE